VFVPPAPRKTSDGFYDPIPTRVTAVLTETDDNVDLARTIETALKDDQAQKAIVDSVANSVVKKLNAAIDTRFPDAIATKATPK
jgi:hypothetical protein